MSRPQIKFELFGCPASLAGDAGTLTQGRTISGLARPIAARSLFSSVDVFQPRNIGSNFKVSMSSGRDAFLGQNALSCPVPQVQLEHEGFRGCAQKRGAGS